MRMEMVKMGGPDRRVDTKEVPDRRVERGVPDKRVETSESTRQKGGGVTR